MTSRTCDSSASAVQAAGAAEQKNLSHVHLKNWSNNSSISHAPAVLGQKSSNFLLVVSGIPCLAEFSLTSLCSFNFSQSVIVLSKYKSFWSLGHFSSSSAGFQGSKFCMKIR